MAAHVRLTLALSRGFLLRVLALFLFILHTLYMNKPLWIIDRSCSPLRYRSDRTLLFSPRPVTAAPLSLDRGMVHVRRVEKLMLITHAHGGVTVDAHARLHTSHAVFPPRGGDGQP